MSPPGPPLVNTGAGGNYYWRAGASPDQLGGTISSIMRETDQSRPVLVEKINQSLANSRHVTVDFDDVA